MLRRTFLALPAAAAVSSARPKKLNLGGVKEKHAWVPMSDGVKLSTWLYIPEGEGPWPVIYEQRYAPIRADRTRIESAEFAAKGYVVATQNFRGAQDSKGHFLAYRALGLGEQRDGADTIDWFLQQPWCNGKVGSYGASQGGYAQNFLAASKPKALHAQYMVDFGASLFHHGYRIGGAARPLRLRGMYKTAGATVKDGEALLADQLAHPVYDDWWKVEDTTLHWDAMSAPSFLIGSWFDRVSLGVVETFQGRHKAHPGKQQLILGPWVHGRYNKDAAEVGELKFPDVAKFSVVDHQMRWFDHYLKGESNGVDQPAPIRYYVMGACGEPGAPGHQWRDAQSWPPPSKETPYLLLDQGRLATGSASSSAESTEWVSDPYNPPVLEGAQPQSGLDQRQLEMHSGARTFTSETLSKPVEWTGMIRARLFFSSSARDADAIVRVTDVYPDGRSILLTDMVRRLRFRNGFEREEFLEPGQVYEATFDVAWLSHIFNKGHKIRVTICSAAAPYWEINPQTGDRITADLPKQMQVARNAIWHTTQRPSALLAPVAG